MFSVKLTGLPELTTVYVRAYATNSKGTSYGTETEFTTVEVDVDVWDGTSVAEKFAGGMGTESDPILISSADQLALFAKNVAGGTMYSGIYLKLTCNIGLNGFNWPYTGGSFAGNFDGDGKVVDGYRGNRSLLGTNTGTIRNLTLKGKITSSTEYEGTFAGKNEGTINNCCFSGDITASNYAGGIAGHNLGIIDGCYAEGTVTGQKFVGGIAGYMSKGRIINCKNSSTVSGNDNIGGILGYAYLSNTLYVENNLNVGNLKGSSAVGGILGYLDYYRGYCYCHLNNSVNYSTGGLVGIVEDIDDCKGGYWLYDIVNNIGQEDGIGGNYTNIDSWFNRNSSACFIKGTDDLVEQLNSWVSSNSGEYTYKKWKYETVDGYACPVFDE